jgi:hypothetical protein
MAANFEPLVNALALKVNPELGKIAELLTTLQVSMEELSLKVSTIESRLNTLDAMKSGASSVQPPKKVEGKKTPGNALLFFREQVKLDGYGLRDKFIRIDGREEMAKQQSSMAKIKETDEKYYSSIANEVWKIMSVAEKAEVKVIFTTYKEQIERTSGEEQLNQDN